MELKYTHEVVEGKWQKEWKKKGIYKADNKKGKKFYTLVELTYSSGDLHIGHWFAWSAPDVYARFKRMQGENVLFPVGGFDSFGLPAENAAIKRGVHPADWTERNIEVMRKQFATMGPSFDWDREVITSRPNYYKWTQWLFLKLYDAGLVYKDKVNSNWCPKCKTVLANEHVENGCCWRHPDTKVVQKKVEQWLVKITDYAERLIWKGPASAKGFSEAGWPKAHKEGQNNWIGKSEGVLVQFPISGFQFPIEVFTTRPDTLPGATFLVLSPEYAQSLIKLVPQNLEKRLSKYIEDSLNKSEQDRKREQKTKTGFDMGILATNPVTGEQIPVFVGDYVLSGVGTGAIMAVPGHDERDLAFAKEHGLAVKKIKPDKALWQKYPKSVTYRLRDWSVSRHRYWGAPVPIIYCSDCGTVPVPYEELPVKLPRDVDYNPTGKAPLATSKSFVATKCPKCGGKAERETQTMDTYVDSSWYFLRYIDPKNSKAPFDKKLVNDWMPIKVYFGGSEHVHGHTLYARFITKFLHDQGYLKSDEFALKRVNHGVVLGSDGAKMSKSRGNVVNPDIEVKKYGADTVRTYLCFMGPHQNAAPWAREGVEGMHRFYQRLWRLFNQKPVGVDTGKMRNQAVQRVTKDIESMRFNTAIASVMEYANHLKANGSSKADLITLAKLIAPFAPHMAEEVWVNVLGQKFSIHQSQWPKFDANLAKEEHSVVIIQIDGKTRGQLIIDNLQLTKEEVIKKARNNEKVSKWLKDKKIKKVIFVPGKIVNFVTH